MGVTTRSAVGVSILLGIAGTALPRHGYGVPMLAMAVFGAAVVIEGVRRHRPRVTAPWYLLAATVLLGGIAVALHAATGRSGLDLHPATQAIVVVSLFTNIAGCALLVRARTEVLDRYQLLDLAVVLLSALVAFEQLVLKPAMASHPPEGMSPTVSSILILSQLSTFALYARFLTLPGRRGPAAWLLLSTFGIGVLGSVLSNVVSPTLGFHAMTYVSMAVILVAVLHPSMHLMTEPSPGAAKRFGVTRMVALGVALVLPAVTATVDHTRDGSLAIGWLLVPMFTVTLLVLARLRLVFAQEQAAREALDGSRAQFQALIQGISDVILVLDRDARVTYASRSSATTLGRQRATLLGADLQELVHGPDARLLSDALDRTWACGTSTRAQLRLAVGDEVRAFEVGFTDRVSDPNIGGVVVILHDVTEREELAARLRHQALHDGLTGLPNRVLFAERVGEAIDRNGEVGVLFIDLDDFKSVNDGLGHAVGDQLLRAVAGRLAATLRGPDLVARLGGDEFAVLVDGAGAAEVGRRILEVLEEPFQLRGLRLHVAASVGVASGVLSSVDELLREADVAMYRAKSEGKGTLAVFGPGMTARTSVS